AGGMVAAPPRRLLDRGPPHRPGHPRRLLHRQGGLRLRLRLPGGAPRAGPRPAAGPHGLPLRERARRRPPPRHRDPPRSPPRPRPGGGDRVTGKKRWAPLSGEGGVLLVVAPAGLAPAGKSLLRVVRVPSTAPGVERRPMPETPFTPEIGHDEVELSAVAVTEA